MQQLEFELISVFTAEERRCLGNISAVLWLDQPLPKVEMQAIAADLNQPASTFLWKENDQIQIRWFAPDGEISLCGHGTAAAVVWLQRHRKMETLHYQAGQVEGQLNDAKFSIDLEPIEIIDHGNAPAGLAEALGVPVLDYFSTRNKDIVLVENEQLLRSMQPRWQELAQLAPFGYAVTAPGESVDFVSRTLVPKVKQLEDHATGSSHAALFPFWAERISKKQMTARQLSPRVGFFKGEMGLSKIRLSGQFRIIAQGLVNRISR